MNVPLETRLGRRSLLVQIQNVEPDDLLRAARVIK